MKVKIKYTITFTQEEDLDNWKDWDNCPPNPTAEDLLTVVREAIKEDPLYILDSLGYAKLTIQTELE